MKILQDVSLQKLSAFRLDYKTKFYAAVSTLDDLREVVNCSDSLQKVVLGGGNNTVFTKNFDGLIIHNKIGGFDVVAEDKENVVLKCGGGLDWDELIEFCVENELYGLENLVGIPGTVGASPIQNIGSYGAEVGSTIDKVEFFSFKTNKIIELSNTECQFSYRDSIFKHELANQGCIVNVFFKLSKIPKFNLTYGNLQELFQDEELSLRKVTETIKKVRDSKLPHPEHQANVGSFFKNFILPKEKAEEIKQIFPDVPIFPLDENTSKISTAWLLDKCGLKNLRRDGLSLYEYSPLVIINQGCTEGKNLIEFVEEVKRQIRERTGLELEIEPNIF